MPQRREICTKNLFSVSKIEMIWQNNGDFLCVFVERYAKKKVDAGKQVKYIGTYFNFEIFRIREKQIPVDKLEIKETKDIKEINVTKFQWEPTGSRFAYLMSDSSGSKTLITFYDVKTGGSLEEIKTIDKSNNRMNELHWSPKGQYIVIAGLKNAGGNLDFIDATDGTSVAKPEHMMASELQWDPTGRYVATIVTWQTHKQDNAVYFWSCIGRLLFKMPMDKLMTFSWRPRPPTSLSDAQIKELKKSMKKYTAKFEMEDKMSLSRANKELLEKRRKMSAEFSQWRQSLVARYNKEKAKRVELRGGVDTDTIKQSEADLEEEKIEFLVTLNTTVEKRNAE